MVTPIKETLAVSGIFFALDDAISETLQAFKILSSSSFCVGTLKMSYKLKNIRKSFSNNYFHIVFVLSLERVDVSNKYNQQLE